MAMNENEYHEYVLAECERQWHENQEELYGAWADQTREVKTRYYTEMYMLLKEEV